VSKGRGLRAHSVVEPGTAVGATVLGAAWLASLSIPRLGGRSAADRGRELAESGAVGVLTWEPGRLSARVQRDGGEIRPVALRVERLGLPAWRSIVAAMARAPRLLAAVLDGELPDELVTAAGDVDGLVPAPAEVRITCGCSSGPGLCDHAAAVWYVAARAIDLRPAQLLDLRGYDSDLTGAVHRRVLRNRTQAARTAQDPGVDPVAAFARVPDPLPPRLALPVRPGTPESLPARPPAGLRIRPEDVQALAADAARRAWELGMGTGDGDLGLDPDTDLARRVSPLVDDHARLIALANATGRDAWALARLGLAWRAAGAAAVEILLRPWSPPQEWLAPAVVALGGLGPARCRRNRVTAEAGGVELRLGRDRRWFLLEREGDTWVLREPPLADPADALRRAGLAAATAAPTVVPEPADAREAADLRAGATRGRPGRDPAHGDAKQLRLPW
jgi:uncharacterized Zn finger protein